MWPLFHSLTLALTPVFIEDGGHWATGTSETICSVKREMKPCAVSEMVSVHILIFEIALPNDDFPMEHWAPQKHLCCLIRAVKVSNFPHCRVAKSHHCCGRGGTFQDWRGGGAQHDDTTQKWHHHVRGVVQQCSHFWAKLDGLMPILPEFCPKTTASPHNIPDLMMSFPHFVTLVAFGGRVFLYHPASHWWARAQKIRGSPASTRGLATVPCCYKPCFGNT